MHFLDSIFIFVLALVLFGPKRLPEIGRQIGKLLVEFRRASNDFKMQIEDELRTMEQQDRQKKLEAAAAQSAAALPAPEAAAQTPVSSPPVSSPSILPPSTGVPVGADSPYAPVTPPELPAATASETALPASDPHAETTSNGHAPLNQQESENEQAQLHHG
jgi:sec-independent protein translocase protein TatB